MCRRCRLDVRVTVQQRRRRLERVSQVDDVDIREEHVAANLEPRHEQPKLEARRRVAVGAAALCAKDVLVRQRGASVLLDVPNLG